MITLKNKTITVIGAQKSGLASVELILQSGGTAKVSEYKSEQEADQAVVQVLRSKQVVCEFNGHTEDFVKSSDLIVISPAVALDSDCYRWAEESSTPILGEIEFAYQFCNKPIIAITGSNGKTTVSTLVSECLINAGYKACLCGNIGKPFSQFVSQSDEYDFFVIEVSSFQLESIHKGEVNCGELTIKGFKPHIAIWLNFTQNHLDRHKDLEEYFQAKEKIFLNQETDDYAVLNFADSKLKELESDITSQVVFFNQNIDSENQENPNYLAVFSLAKILNIEEAVVAEVIENFKGVEHRLEWVREFEGIDYINDSKATTAEASQWALQNLKKPVVMICGGRDKNIDFSILKELIGKKVKKMIVIGEAQKKIANTFEDIVGVSFCDALDSAVECARKNAQSGDCIVLSPMCASFDMFKSFEDRGKVYKEIVQDLK